MGLFAKLLSKDFPSTAAALAMGRNALDVTGSEGLQNKGVFTAGMVGGVVVGSRGIVSFACRGKLSFEKLILALE